MALRFIDSVQHYMNAVGNSTEYLFLRKWTVGQSYVSSTGGRRNAPYLTGGGGAMKTLTYTPTWFIGAAYELINGSQGTLNTIQGGGAVVASLNLNSDYTLSIKAGGNIIYTSTLSVSDATVWHYYETEFTTFGTGTQTGTLTGSLWVDGLLWGTFFGTANQVGNNYLSGSYCANQVGFSANVGCQDFYALDTSATDINGGTTTLTGRLGDVQIDAIFPAADVTTTWGTVGGDGTHAYSCVNDPIVISSGTTTYGTYGSPDDDTSYVTTTNTGSSESFTYQPLASFTGTIFGIQYLVCAKKDAEGSREIAMYAGSSTVYTENFLGANNYLSDYYVYYIAPMDSYFGTAWTTGVLNTTTFGVTCSG